MEHNLSFQIVADVSCEKKNYFIIYQRARNWIILELGQLRNVLQVRRTSPLQCCFKKVADINAFKLQKHKMEQESMQLKELRTGKTMNYMEGELLKR